MTILIVPFQFGRRFEILGFSIIGVGKYDFEYGEEFGIIGRTPASRTLCMWLIESDHQSVQSERRSFEYYSIPRWIHGPADWPYQLPDIPPLLGKSSTHFT